ncbi:hypothetical protein KC345_g5894 [Hortaea werneckii]|nr:hypothetical protein KC345_g5894 [Hortaea werneckii]
MNRTCMFGMSIKQEGIEIQGDETAFAQWTHVWRRVLELLHDALVGPTPADEEPDVDIDHNVGRYVYITSPVWGKCKVFYEQSGSGQQPIVFLHTAGSDGRQYHGVMNDERGTIPLQGSDYLNMQRQWHDRSPYVNQSLFNPEWIYGMTSPTAPLKNRQLLWHLYSAQAYGIFQGDLDFYFGGKHQKLTVRPVDLPRG